MTHRSDTSGKIVLTNDGLSALRFVEHLKILMNENGMIAVAIIANRKFQFDVYYEDDGACKNHFYSREDVIRMAVNIHFENPFELGVHRYMTPEQIFTQMESGKKQMFWDSQNNWSEVK